MKPLTINFWETIEHIGQSLGIHKSFTTLWSVSQLPKLPELHCSLFAVDSLPVKKTSVILLENRNIAI